MSERSNDVHVDAVAWPAFGVPARVPAPMRRPADAAAKAAAKADGFEEGRREGLESARKEIESLRIQLRNAIAALGTARVQVTTDQMDSLSQVSRAVCRRVLGMELTTNPEIFANLVRAGVEHLGNAVPPIRVHVHPEEQAWLAEIPACDVELVPDETVGRGAVSVRDQRRCVDIDLMADLEAVFEQARSG